MALRWNATNVAVRQDPAGNIKPDKERSSERIDPPLVSALGRAMVNGSAAWSDRVLGHPLAVDRVEQLISRAAPCGRRS